MARPKTAKRMPRTRLVGGASLTEAEILAQIPAARARSVEAARSGLRARSARYSLAHETLFLTLTNGTIIGMKAAGIPAARATIRATVRAIRKAISHCLPSIIIRTCARKWWTP